MANFISGIITLAISAVVMANVFIYIIKNNTGTTNATEGGGRLYMTTVEVSMWSLMSLLGIVGLLYGVMNVFGLA